MDNRFLNQKEIINNDVLSKTTFVVIGAGAIGSAFVLGLSKMGARHITVYDYDVLENHNFANQLHPISQIDKPKVESLMAVAKDYGDCTIVPINGAWTTGNAVDATIVVSCVDNMDVRSVLWNHYKDRCALFLDGRMGAFVYKVFGVDVSSRHAVEYYASTLHTQDKAAPERCGEKSIIYTVFMVAAMMLSQVREWLTEEAKPYRATEIVYDALNHTMTKVSHQEEVKMNVIEAQEEVNEAELPTAV